MVSGRFWAFSFDMSGFVFAGFNAGDNGDCCVQHDAVCVNVGNVSAGIGQFCINNILVIGIDTERCGICRKGHSRKFRFGKRLFAQQVFNCHRLAAVVSGRNSYRLRILKEQTEGDGVEERFPTVLADFDFAGGLFAVFPLCGDCDALLPLFPSAFRPPLQKNSP